MAIVSGFSRSYSGLICPCQSRLPFWSQRCDEIGFNNHSVNWHVSTKIPGRRIHYSPGKRSSNKPVLSAGTDHYRLNYEDDMHHEPLWLTIIKEAIWGLKSLSAFLVEQPSQLKYIEWPTFGSTLRTATFTLVIVALLIVALWSVDSILCYLLGLFLRRT